MYVKYLKFEILRIWISLLNMLYLMESVFSYMLSTINPFDHVTGFLQAFLGFVITARKA